MKRHSCQTQHRHGDDDADVAGDLDAGEQRRDRAARDDDRVVLGVVERVGQEGEDPGVEEPADDRADDDGDDRPDEPRAQLRDVLPEGHATLVGHLRVGVVAHRRPAWGRSGRGRVVRLGDRFGRGLGDRHHGRLGGGLGLGVGVGRVDRGRRRRRSCPCRPRPRRRRRAPVWNRDRSSATSAAGRGRARVRPGVAGWLADPASPGVGCVSVVTGSAAMSIALRSSCWNPWEMRRKSLRYRPIWRAALGSLSGPRTMRATRSTTISFSGPTLNMG